MVHRVVSGGASEPSDLVAAGSARCSFDPTRDNAPRHALSLWDSRGGAPNSWTSAAAIGCADRLVSRSCRAPEADDRLDGDALLAACCAAGHARNRTCNRTGVVTPLRASAKSDLASPLRSSLVAAAEARKPSSSGTSRQPLAAGSRAATAVAASAMASRPQATGKGCSWSDGCCVRHCRASPSCWRPVNSSSGSSSDGSSGSVMLATAQARVYPRGMSVCGFRADCPFLSSKHTCVPTTPQAAASLLSQPSGCWIRHTPPHVGEESCGAATARWDSHRFASSLARHGATTVHFVGDSLAAQQWRTLLCAELANIPLDELAKAPCTNWDVVRTAQRARSGDGSRSSTRPICVRIREVSEGVGSAAKRLPLRACFTRGERMASVLEAADEITRAAQAANDPPCVLVLSSFAHEPNVSEATHVNDLLRWMHRTGPSGLPLLSSRADTFVWRTREVSHYGQDGAFAGLERHGCQPVTAARREALSLRSALGVELQAALQAAGIGLIDGAASTADAHRAHQLVCGEDGDKGTYYDCRHFCTPGPVQAWNMALVDGLLELPPARPRRIPISVQGSP